MEAQTPPCTYLYIHIYKSLLLCYTIITFHQYAHRDFTYLNSSKIFACSSTNNTFTLAPFSHAHISTTFFSTPPINTSPLYLSLPLKDKIKSSSRATNFLINGEFPFLCSTFRCPGYLLPKFVFLLPNLVTIFFKTAEP